MFGNLDNPSLIFWPVGCGDSTTIAISEDITLQIDINSGTTANNTDNERMLVVDELVNKLPRRDGKPYLSCFALTHPDLDHINGFAELLKQVTIGELWFTPRVFWEYKKDLSADAVTFRKEALRRVNQTIDANGDPGTGNRIQVIGYSDLLQKENYIGLPDSFLTIPGQVISTIDGIELSDIFTAFVHAPFKDDSAGERNETSLALHIELKNAGISGRGLFFGDLAYPTIRRIFDETHQHNNDSFLIWNVYLASHHCSKKIMYEHDLSGKDVLKQDILDELDQMQVQNGYIVSSSSPFPLSNEPGDNPPHVIAKNRYEEIASGGFLCTGEYSTEQNPRPIIFSVTEKGIMLVDDAFSLSRQAQSSTLASAVTAARGSGAPPGEKVGFGIR